MRFLLLVVPTRKAEYEAGHFGEPEQYEEMSKFNDEMKDAGVMLAAEGLHPSSKGARIEFGDGAPTVTDGPFPESKELIGGYWVINVNSKEEAVDWARRAPMERGDVIEVRQIFEMEDFEAEIQQAAGYTRD